MTISQVARVADDRVVPLHPKRRATDRDAADVRVVVLGSSDEGADRETFRAGLLASPAVSSPKFFYDLQGSALFTAICELDEYYPTRTEARIFTDHCADIAARLPSRAQWIDLGCGDCQKALGWLGPASAVRYVGVDFAEAWLRNALIAVTGRLAKERASANGRGGETEVLGVVADFTKPFDLHDVLRESTAPPIFFYPGSSIGNFVADDARDFLTSVREHIERHPFAGGKLLIGIDLVKDVSTLTAAYDDALGVTAAFNRNVLRVANRLLDADFDPAAFDHRAVFDAEHERIEMRLVASRRQIVRIGNATRRYDAGETIVTEFSHKYTVEKFGALLESAGFAGGDRLHCWRDADDWFGVFVAEPA